MNAVVKALVLLLALALQGAGWLILWDGDARRVAQAREVIEKRAEARELLRFRMPRAEATRPKAAPLEFYDLMERNFPAAYARHFDAPTTEGMRATYEAMVSLGREVYVREGCFHCHTQAVRAGTADVERWGEPTRIGREDIRTAGMALTGTRRVGPDLAREGQRRSNDWHAAHLLRPRAMFPGSIMPGYPWLFEEVEGRRQPNRDGLALIVYLQTLGNEAD
jgi:hypothetical protein